MGALRLPPLLGIIVLIIIIWHPFNVAAQPVVSINQTIATYESVGSGVDPLIDFLIFIAVGDLAFSVVIVLLLSLPLLLDKSLRYRQLVVDAVEKKFLSAKDAVGDQLTNVGAAIASVNPVSLIPRGSRKASIEQGSLQSTFEASVVPETANNNNSKEEDSRGPSGDGEQQEHVQDLESPQRENNLNEVVQIGLRTTKPSSKVMLTWAALAIALFIAGAVLVSIGVDVVFSRSIVSVAVTVFNISSLPDIVKSILVAGLALIAFCDVVVLYVFFFMQPKQFTIRGKTFKNRIGGWDFVNRRTFEIHVVCIALMALVVSIASIIFALGFTVMCLQIIARIACKAVFTRQVAGANAQQICVAIPVLMNGEQVCGVDAFEICMAATGFEVQLLAIGAVLIIWCHLIWLVALVASQSYNLESRVVLRPEEKEKLLAEAAR